MPGPISPEQARAGKCIPEVVFEVVNTLIAARCGGKNDQLTIKQDEVVDALVKHGISRSSIFENSWLDFETEYRRVGWRVEYDKPGYNEDYAPFWRFWRVSPA